MDDLILTPLYSGSSGNSTLIKCGGTKILIDAGFNCKRITEALKSIKEEVSDIDGIFITHTHSDHTGAVDVLVRKYNIPIYGTESVINRINKYCSKPHDRELDRVINNFEDVKIGSLTIKSCETSHDSSDVSVCYKVTNGVRTCMVATDLGFVSDSIMDFAKEVDAAIIESNYDEYMLDHGPYDYMLKKRVKGKGGHLSNEDSARLIRAMAICGTQKFILGHLSENNNTPQLALESVTKYLQSYRDNILESISIGVAERYTPTKSVIV
ncbi:MAG: MBL fold metallo-hydrolase [Clostridia bacterium]|nr:MBL fold metallo-hydrolase [Clostridia bacterium]